MHVDLKTPIFSLCNQHSIAAIIFIAHFQLGNRLRYPVQNRRYQVQPSHQFIYRLWLVRLVSDLSLLGEVANFS